jgi:deoxyribose-phosphate aldolase
MFLTVESFRKRIEYSLCPQFASDADVRAFCERAKATRVGVACVNPVNVKLAAEILRDSGVEISGNVGFPFGCHFADVKALETRKCVADGATQIDVVMNVGALRSRRDDDVRDEIRTVVDAAEGRPVKVIIETWVLTREEKGRACRIAEESGAHLVKTTTGVRTQYLELATLSPAGVSPGAVPGSVPPGAVVEDILLMRQVLSPKMKIKASGGIYDLDTAVEMFKAGADQLGVSKGEQLIKDFISRFGKGVEI